MTNVGATPPSAHGLSFRRTARSGSGRRRGKGSAIAVSLGLGCGILGAICALAATDLSSGLFLPASETRSVAAAPMRAAENPQSSHRVIPSPAAEPLPRHEKPAIRHAARAADAPRDAARATRVAAPVRHRMAPPVVMTWIPAHLLDLPRTAEAARFETSPSAGGILTSGLDGTRSFVPPPADPVAVAAVGAPPAPAVRVAVVVPVLALPAALPAATAEEALEAALVPTPRARPSRGAGTPPAVSLRTRSVPPASALAYARPDAGTEEADRPALGGLFSPKPRAGNGVAIYDIRAATVYLPNGERLEAHSGLGAMRDNPRFVHARNRGPTPPHTYDLRMRESLFHGVQAIRLTPVGGERRIYNRNGLLAHTYMLGARGDSNGCVSIKDYKRFLAAFKRGEVRRLVVVSQMSDPSSRLASLFGRRG